MLWMGAHEMLGNLKCSPVSEKSDWTCDACSAPQSQQSPRPTRSLTPPTKQISDDSTFNVLQVNANGIGNKLTELEVVLERNNVKVAVIQESKLSSKSKNPCIQNYITVRKDRSHGQGGRLLIFIHRSITFSKQPSSPESLSYPHLEELSIKAELGNTKFIISNIYIPPASSCSNGYHSSIEHFEVPRLNKDIHKRICEHKRPKWRDFVENMDHKTDITKLWRTIKGIDGTAKRTASTEARSHRPSS